MIEITKFNQFKHESYYYVTSIKNGYGRLCQAKSLWDNRISLIIDGEHLSVWASDFYEGAENRYTFIEVNLIDDPEYFL